MPKKKKPGARSDSPDKLLTSGGGSNQYGRESTSWMGVSPFNGPHVQHSDKENALMNLQQMFHGTIESDVVYMVFMECQGKAEDALEKLLLMVPSSSTPSGPNMKMIAQSLNQSGQQSAAAKMGQQQVPQYPGQQQQQPQHQQVTQYQQQLQQQQQHPSQAYDGQLQQHQQQQPVSADVMPGGTQQQFTNQQFTSMGYITSAPMASMDNGSSQTAHISTQHYSSSTMSMPVNIRSRLPSVCQQANEPTELPTMSPRTPNIGGLEFPQFKQEQSNVQSAMEALDSYANGPNFDLGYSMDSQQGMFEWSTGQDGASKSPYAKDIMSGFNRQQSFENQQYPPPMQGFSNFDISVQGNQNNYGMDDGQGLSSTYSTQYVPTSPHYASSPEYASTSPQYPGTTAPQYVMTSSPYVVTTTYSSAHNSYQTATTSSCTSGFNGSSMPSNSSGYVPHNANYSTGFTAMQPNDIGYSKTDNYNTSLSGYNVTNVQPQGAGYSSANVAYHGPVQNTQNAPKSSDPNDHLPSDTGDSSSNKMTETRAQLQNRMKANRPVRKAAISLNPEERESLEQLIEEVIIGGVGEDIIGSDDSTSEDDEEGTKDGETKKDKKDEHGKTHPSHLKVAAKHMKNLPPRFLRRLQTAQKQGEVRVEGGLEGLDLDYQPESVLPPQPEEEEKPKEKEQKRQGPVKGKKKGKLLESLDPYFDDLVASDSEEGECKSGERKKKINDNQTEQLNVEGGIGASRSNESILVAGMDNLFLDPGGSKVGGSGSPSRTSPNLARIPPPNVQNNSNITLSPNVLNCHDLEKELLKLSAPTPNVPTQSSVFRSLYNEPPKVQRIGPLSSNKDMGVNIESLQDRDNRSQFSVDAPEFVPREFTPVNVPPPVLQGEYVRPAQPFAVKRGSPYHSPIGRLSPAPLTLTAGQVAAATQGRNSPSTAFILSTLPPNVSTATVSSAHTLQNQAALQNQAIQSALKAQAALQNQAVLQNQQAALQNQAALQTQALQNQAVLQNQAAMQNAGLPYASFASVQSYAYPSGFPQQFPPYRGTFLPPGSAPNYPPPNWTGDKALSQASTQVNPQISSSQYGYPKPGAQLNTTWMTAGVQVSPRHSPVMVRSSRMGANQTPPSKGKNSQQMTNANQVFAAFPNNQTLIPNNIANAEGRQEGGNDIKQDPPSPAELKDLLKAHIMDGKKFMIILRGPPGSGKSTLAKELQLGGVVLTTDEFFIRGDNYEYDISKLADAHEWNRKRRKSQFTGMPVDIVSIDCSAEEDHKMNTHAIQALDLGKNPVIIDNTNSQSWEMKPYVSLALQYKYNVEILEPNTPWLFKAKELAKKNTHGVMLESIQRMIDRYERSVSIQSIMGLKRTDAQLPFNYHQQLQQQLAILHQIQQLQQPPQQVKKPHRKRKRRRRKKKGAAGAEAGDDSKEISSEEEATPDRDADSTVDDKTDDDSKTDSIVPSQVAKVSKSSENKSLSPVKDERISLEKIQEDDEFFLKDEADVQEMTVASKDAASSLQDKTVADIESPASNETGPNPSVNVNKESQLDADKPSPDVTAEDASSKRDDASVMVEVKAGDLADVSTSASPGEDSTGETMFESSHEAHSSRTTSEKEQLPNIYENTADVLQEDETQTAGESEVMVALESLVSPEDGVVSAYDIDPNTTGSTDVECHVRSSPQTMQTDEREYPDTYPPEVQVTEPSQSSSNGTPSSEHSLPQSKLDTFPRDEESAKSEDIVNNTVVETDSFSKPADVLKGNIGGSDGGKIMKEPKTENDSNDTAVACDEVKPAPGSAPVHSDMERSSSQEKSDVKEVSASDVPVGQDFSLVHDETGSTEIPPSDAADAQETDPDDSIEHLSAVHFVEPERLRGGLEKALKQILKRDAGPDCIEEALREHLPQHTVPEEIRMEIMEMIREKIETGVANQEVALLTRRSPRGKRSYSLNDAALSSATDPAIVEHSPRAPAPQAGLIANLRQLEQMQKEQMYWQQQLSSDPYQVGSNVFDMPTKNKLAWESVADQSSDPAFPVSDLDWSDVASNSSTHSSPASRGPRHKKQSRHRNQPSVPLPRIDDNVRTHLMTSDWSIPSFHTRSHESPVRQVKSCMVRNVSTYTHPKDFASVQRMMHDELNLYELREKGFISVLDCSPRDIQTGEESSDLSDVPPQKLMIHQGCSTEDLESHKEGLEFLKACFPSVSESDHRDILERCERDVEWAVNILLDSGYEYNDPSHSFGSFSSRYEERASPTTVEEKPAKSPLPLVALCQDVLTTTQLLASEEIHENLATGSMRRLQSIEEVRHQLSPESSYEAISYMLPELLPYQDADGLAAAANLALVDSGSEVNEAVMVPSTSEAEQPTSRHNFVFSLPPQFARQLIQEFGPVGSHTIPELLSAADLQVRLSREAAKELHHCWASTLLSTFHHEEQAITDMTHQDEELARQWQEEEDRLHRQLIDPLKVRYHSPRESRHDATMGSPQRPAVLLSSIMDEQMAIQLTQEEYVNHHDGTSNEATLATKLKRKELYKKFPNIRTATLDEIYRAHGYSLDMTVQTIQNSLGKEETTQNVMTPEAVIAHENALVERVKKESQEMQWSDFEENGGASGEAFQTLEDPTYRDIRAEAAMHFKLRQECFQKAQEAYRRGMKPVASFYSQQGHVHSAKLKEANRRAAEQIMKHRESLYQNNNTVDLHGLHVDEALEVLENLLAQREQELASHPDKRRHHVFVVTGRGRHSQGGIARIRPAVCDFLNRKKYSFMEMQPGLLRILLR